MKADHVFHIDATGQVETLYTEELPLFALGAAPKISRASEIEFNNKTQKWEVKIGGAWKFDHPSREECLKWEHEHINALLLAK